MMSNHDSVQGMSFTDTSPCVFGSRSTDLVIGTNPIAFAASGVGDDNFALDMATSAVSIGKVRINERLQCGVNNPKIKLINNEKSIYIYV